MHKQRTAKWTAGERIFKPKLGGSNDPLMSIDELFDAVLPLLALVHRQLRQLAWYCCKLHAPNSFETVSKLNSDAGSC